MCNIAFFLFAESGCFMVGKSIEGHNMSHFFPEKFEEPNEPFAKIVENEYACRDLCIAKAPECGGFTYFAERIEGEAEKGACLLKAHKEWIKPFKALPYTYIPNSATISGSLSCPGIEKGKGFQIYIDFETMDIGNFHVESISQSICRQYFVEQM